MTDHRTHAEHLIDRARTTTHLVDVPGIGAVATAAAILDLADALRESNQPAGTNAEVNPGCPCDECAEFADTIRPPDEHADTTDQRLCMAEGRTPRGNRVVCSQPRDNHTRHSAGGYWWDDDGFSGSTLPPGTVPTMPDVVLHTSEGGDTEPVTSSDHLLHEHLLVNPPTERLGALVDSAARWARVTAGSGLSNVLTACVEAINDLHRQTVEQHNAKPDAVDPDLHEHLRRMTNRLRRSLGNLDIGAELPFNDVVSDLRHHVDAVVEELNEARR
ncbi:hypothetical protein SEA_ASHERTHEMAN_58 [Gordonia phage Ashertheman]|uniref:Uncharacterized protein n=1 Tax=Gordonia phage Ashertheman TaxID=2301692 RepID=A0A385DWP8_9CAUD|nr:hypothetical protein J1764_gp58 [Gordonia phage Ashertheman]AXQ62965.1 hypothetical protein SEA_ASHERTHEMAN_58 [Gordonia phage Ashertheman]